MGDVLTLLFHTSQALFCFKACLSNSEWFDSSKNVPCCWHIYRVTTPSSIAFLHSPHRPSNSFMTASHRSKKLFPFDLTHRNRLDVPLRYPIWQDGRLENVRKWLDSCFDTVGFRIRLPRKRASTREAHTTFSWKMCTDTQDFHAFFQNPPRPPFSTLSVFPYPAHAHR